MLEIIKTETGKIKIISKTITIAIESLDQRKDQEVVVDPIVIEKEVTMKIPIILIKTETVLITTII
jgi:hypothetical protein